MALKKLKSHFEEKFRDCNDVGKCEMVYHDSSSEEEDRLFAIEKMVDFPGGSARLVTMLLDEDITDKYEISAATAALAGMNPKEAPIEEILELLKSEDAYLRNMAISILQDYGDEIKYYIVKYLIGDDRDLRIFAINVLGDVNFAESREMMLELLESEQDVNVAMTAVDYLSEIGEPEDITALESLKARFKNEPYVEFAVNRAIRVIKG